MVKDHALIEGKVNTKANEYKSEYKIQKLRSQVA